MASILKIKIKTGTVEIHTASNLAKQESVSIIKNHEDPHPDLVNAFADLEKTVYNVLQFPRDWMCGRIKVSGVSFKESESGVRRASIAGKVELDTSESPFEFNTPFIPFSCASSRVKSLGSYDSDRMEKLLCEAADFITGKRAQLELPGMKGAKR